MDRTHNADRLLALRNQRARHTSRRGVSFIEFLGCVTALVGGVVLGAMYLGIDLKSSGLQVLARAGVIQAAPSDKPSDKPQPSTQADAADATTSILPLSIASVAGTSGFAENAPSRHRGPLDGETTSATTDDSEGREATTGDATSGPATTSSQTGDPLSTVSDLTQTVKAALEAELAREKAAEVSPEEQARLTNAYWEALCKTIREEAERRQPTRIEEADLQLFEFLEFRENGHAAAAEKLATLSLRGVDLHVANYALKVRKWHESGAYLYRRARLLLTDAPSSQHSGPLAQGWRSAATQHRMEEKLLTEKHLSVAAHLAHAQETRVQARGAAPTQVGAPFGSN